MCARTGNGAREATARARGPADRVGRVPGAAPIAARRDRARPRTAAQCPGAGREAAALFDRGEPLPRRRGAGESGAALGIARPRQRRGPHAHARVRPAQPEPHARGRRLRRRVGIHRRRRLLAFARRRALQHQHRLARDRPGRARHDLRGHGRALSQQRAAVFRDVGPGDTAFARRRPDLPATHGDCQRRLPLRGRPRGEPRRPSPHLRRDEHRRVALERRRQHVHAAAASRGRGRRGALRRLQRPARAADERRARPRARGVLVAFHGRPLLAARHHPAARVLRPALPLGDLPQRRRRWRRHVPGGAHRSGHGPRDARLRALEPERGVRRGRVDRERFRPQRRRHRRLPERPARGVPLERRRRDVERAVAQFLVRRAVDVPARVRERVRRPALLRRSVR